MNEPNKYPTLMGLPVFYSDTFEPPKDLVFLTWEEWERLKKQKPESEASDEQN